jgi:copper homeostasis protein
LSEGGITPSIGLVRQVVRATHLPVMVMIRPRGGGFVYSTAEIDVMRDDIDAVSRVGAHGVVLGALTPDRTIDVDTCHRLLEHARQLHTTGHRRGGDPLSVTFHRAFDILADPMLGLKQLVDLGFDRVLTSGQAASAAEACELIAELVASAGNRLHVMPGVGITPDNVAAVVTATGASDIHASASGWEADTEAEPRVLPAPRRVTCEEKVRRIRQALTALQSGTSLGDVVTMAHPVS